LAVQLKTSWSRAAENELDLASDETLSRESSMETETVRAKRTNVWQDTFSPQMNSNLKKLPASYYDHPSEKKTVWDEIIKADTIRKVAFHHFDKNSVPPALLYALCGRQ
jgi:hypothetical protein